MKIVDKKTLMSLPAGTIYHNYKPCVFGPPYIRDSVYPDLENDFFMIPLGDSPLESDDVGQMVSRLEEMREHGVSYPVDLETPQREGLYGKSSLYAVWERDDLRKLKVVIETAIAVSEFTIEIPTQNYDPHMLGPFQYLEFLANRKKGDP